MTPIIEESVTAASISKSDLGHFDVRSIVHSPLPRIPFENIARAILGHHYDLSLVVCGDALARRIYHYSYGNSGHVPNVLSFPLNKDSGEIFLNVRKAEREARYMHISLRSRLAHLYVHGCFHLAGYDHSDEMEQLEDSILKRFRLL
jgi:rRNA maturation RNase YbeY